MWSWGSGAPQTQFHPRRRDLRVALQTKLVHVVTFEQLCVTGAVRRVTGRATLSLQGRMLEHKRPLFVGVALKAGCIGAREPGLFRFEPPVWVVAVAAVHRAFKHAVMKGLRELGLRLLWQVAQRGVS